MIAGIKRLVISVVVLTLIFKVGLRLSWEDTFWGIMICAFILFMLQAIFDFGRDVARAMDRQQTNYNFNQTVVEEPKVDDQTQGPLHPDFTRPDSAREAYPAVITIRRERNKS